MLSSWRRLLGRLPLSCPLDRQAEVRSLLPHQTNLGDSLRHWPSPACSGLRPRHSSPLNRRITLNGPLYNSSGHCSTLNGVGFWFRLWTTQS